MSPSSWLPIAPNSPFSLANIPFGIISDPTDTSKRPAIAIGDLVIDLRALAAGGAFSRLPDFTAHLSVFGHPDLNAFAALGLPMHKRIREYLQQLLGADTPFAPQLKDNVELKKRSILPMSEIRHHLPLKIGDYTDFYAGINHAFNVGALFRGADNALQPNYKHLPVGYHGRVSSIQVSGGPVRRPCGQILPYPAAKTPIFSPCKKLDIELEVAAFVCKGNPLGTPIPISKAAEHIFGYVLMNDWSARDIQAWEYVPLGPFGSKNFATTISPWVVLADALEAFRTATLEPANRESLLPYLREESPDSGYDIRLTVELVASGRRRVVSRSNASNLLYSFPQMLTHHSVTGCNMNVGDLLGSGTISGITTDSLGSLLEITKNGKEPIQLDGGLSRTFLEDGDEVILSGTCGEEGSYVGFGECKGTILPAFKQPN